MNANRRKYVLFTLFAIISLILDQWSKIWAREVLRPLGRGSAKVVVDGYFSLQYSENTGVAFGMMTGMAGGRIVLTLVALFALGLVIYYLRQTDNRHVRMQIALGLVGGGAIGNLVDRITFGRVTDFILWHYRDRYYWPNFNIADAALVVGVGLMALDIFRGKGPSQQPAGTDPASKQA